MTVVDISELKYDPHAPLGKTLQDLDRIIRSATLDPKEPNYLESYFQDADSFDLDLVYEALTVLYKPPAWVVRTIREMLYTKRTQEQQNYYLSSAPKNVAIIHKDIKQIVRVLQEYNKPVYHLTASYELDWKKAIEWYEQLRDDYLESDLQNLEVLQVTSTRDVIFRSGDNNCIAVELTIEYNDTALTILYDKVTDAVIGNVDGTPYHLAFLTGRRGKVSTDLSISYLIASVFDIEGYV
jgi:hypothetical protein